jgi:hypothetical protein
MEILYREIEHGNRCGQFLRLNLADGYQFTVRLPELVACNN